jgi:hypothetical protein
MTTEETRAACIEGLRQLAGALEQHPGMPLPAVKADFCFMGAGNPRADLAAAARALPCTWRKHVWDGQSGNSYFELEGSLGGVEVELRAYRDAVCTRVVKGTEDRETEEVVRPAETRKVVKPVEVVEWDCGPLLAPEASRP